MTHGHHAEQLSIPHHRPPPPRTPLTERVLTVPRLTSSSSSTQGVKSCSTTILLSAERPFSFSIPTRTRVSMLDEPVMRPMPGVRTEAVSSFAAGHRSQVRSRRAGSRQSRVRSGRSGSGQCRSDQVRSCYTQRLGESYERSSLRYICTRSSFISEFMSGQVRSGQVRTGLVFQ